MINTFKSFVLSFKTLNDSLKVILFACFCALFFVFAIPPFNCYLLEFVSLSFAFFIFHENHHHLKSSQVFLFGFIFSLIIIMVTFSWLINTISIFGGLSYWVTCVTYVVYSSFMALKLGLLFYIPHKLKKRYNYPLLISFIVTLFVLESFFPEILTLYLGSVQIHNTYFIQMADIIGVKGISILVVLVSYFIYQYFVSKDKRKLFILSIILFITYSYSFFRFLEISSLVNKKKMFKTLHIGIVQPNIAFTTDHYQLKKDNDRLLSLTDQLLKNNSTPFDLIIWPESAVPFVINREYSADSPVTKLKNYLQQFKTSLIYNTLVEKKDPVSGQYGIYSQALLYIPGQKEDQAYSKIKLLPFGEFMPLGETFPSLKKLILQVGDLKHGQKITNFQFNNYLITPQICYEITDPVLTQKFTRHGSLLIANLVNDKWFGKSYASELHLEAASFRAIENRIPIIRAANSGISTVIGIKGLLISKRLPIFTEGLIDTQIKIYPNIKSIYKYLGDWPLILVLIYLFIRGFFASETRTPKLLQKLLFFKSK